MKLNEVRTLIVDNVYHIDQEAYIELPSTSSIKQGDRLLVSDNNTEVIKGVLVVKVFNTPTKKIKVLSQFIIDTSE